MPTTRCRRTWCPCTAPTEASAKLSPLAASGARVVQIKAGQRAAVAAGGGRCLERMAIGQQRSELHHHRLRRRVLGERHAHATGFPAAVDLVDLDLEVARDSFLSSSFNDEAKLRVFIELGGAASYRATTSSWVTIAVSGIIAGRRCGGEASADGAAAAEGIAAAISPTSEPRRRTSARSAAISCPVWSPLAADSPLVAGGDAVVARAPRLLTKAPPTAAQARQRRGTATQATPRGRVRDSEEGICTLRIEGGRVAPTIRPFPALDSPGSGRRRGPCTGS